MVARRRFLANPVARVREAVLAAKKRIWRLLRNFLGGLGRAGDLRVPSVFAGPIGYLTVEKGEGLWPLLSANGEIMTEAGYS